MRARRISKLHLGLLLEFYVEFGDDRGVVARPEIRQNAAGSRAGGDRGTGEDVVDPPSDVSLAQVSPGSPPGEELVVVGIGRAAHVDEADPQNLLQERTFLGKLSDHRPTLLRVNVAVGAGDVQVPAEDEAEAGGVRLADERLE